MERCAPVLAKICLSLYLRASASVIIITSVVVSSVLDLSFYCYREVRDSTLTFLILPSTFSRGLELSISCPCFCCNVSYCLEVIVSGPSFICLILPSINMCGFVLRFRFTCSFWLSVLSSLTRN